MSHHNERKTPKTHGSKSLKAKLVKSKRGAFGAVLSAIRTNVRKLKR